MRQRSDADCNSGCHAIYDHPMAIKPHCGRYIYIHYYIYIDYDTNIC